MNYIKVLICCFIMLFSFTTDAQWETETLPDGRSEISSVAIGDNIYFVGGALSGIERYLKMNIYNVPTKTWSTEDVPNGTRGPRTVAINNKLYFGDVEGDRTIYVYDTDAKTWDEIEVPGFIGTLTHMDNKLIIEDGGDLLIYDINTELWVEYDFDYNPYATVTAINGKVVLAGGNPNIARIYDLASDTWSEGALSIERDDPRAVSLDNKMYFIGGEAAGFAWTGRIDIYDTESNSWSIDSLSRDRNRFDVTVHNNKLIVAGGQIFSFSGQWRKEVDILDTNTNTWETVEMPTGRRYPSVVGHGNKIYIAGGDDDEDNLDIVEVFTLTNTSNTNELSQTNIKLYPNPTSQRLSIETDENVGQLEIIDIDGRSTHITLNQYGQSHELDVSFLKPGIYFLKFENKVQPIRFVKQ